MLSVPLLAVRWECICQERSLVSNLWVIRLSSVSLFHGEIRGKPREPRYFIQRFFFSRLQGTSASRQDENQHPSRVTSSTERRALISAKKIPSVDSIEPSVVLLRRWSTLFRERISRDDRSRSLFSFRCRCDVSNASSREIFSAIIVTSLMETWHPTRLDDKWRLGNQSTCHLFTLLLNEHVRERERERLAQGHKKQSESEGEEEGETERGGGGRGMRRKKEKDLLSPLRGVCSFLHCIFWSFGIRRRETHFNSFHGRTIILG